MSDHEPIVLVKPDVTSDAGAAHDPVSTARLPSVLKIIADAEQLLGDVEHALGHLDSGSYGICEVCGGAIPAVLLETFPVLRRCAAHSV